MLESGPPDEPNLAMKLLWHWPRSTESPPSCPSCPLCPYGPPHLLWGTETAELTGFHPLLSEHLGFTDWLRHTLGVDVPFSVLLQRSLFSCVGGEQLESPVARSVGCKLQKPLQQHIRTGSSKNSDFLPRNVFCLLLPLGTLGTVV